MLSIWHAFSQLLHRNIQTKAQARLHWYEDTLLPVLVTATPFLENEA